MTNDQHVDFNFDSWEREAEVKPFTIVIGGKPYQAIDPFDLDARKFSELMDGDDFAGQFRMLFPKDADKILAAKVIKLGAVSDFGQKIAAHYGLGPTDA